MRRANRCLVILTEGIVAASGLSTKRRSTYKVSATDQIKRSTVTTEEFIRRFLQHVLPKRFIKVRYYGLLSPANRHLLLKARQLLGGVAGKVKSEDS